MSEAKHVLLLLDGEPPSDEQFSAYSATVELFVATDGAAKYFMRKGILPNAIVGDMDTLVNEDRLFFESKAVTVISDDDQYSNDFEKALKYIQITAGRANVTVLGIHGKRTDHILTNLSVMLRFTNSFSKLLAIDATFEHHFLTQSKPTIHLQKRYGTLVSLTPMPVAQNVKTAGLMYSVNGQEMMFGVREGLSNYVVSEDGADVSIESGSLLVSVEL